MSEQFREQSQGSPDLAVLHESPALNAPVGLDPSFDIGGMYGQLLEREPGNGLTNVEREIVGLRVATLERSQVVADFHLARLLAAGVDESVIVAVTDFPVDGPLSDRLAAMLTHVDSLTCASRQGKPGALAVMLAAGLSTDEIVFLSQLTASLSFQIRVMATIRALDDVA